MSRAYNVIYSHLVRGGNDIVGHIAYSLYKSEKIAYIENFKANNSGKEPDEMDLKPFHDATCIQSRLNSYRKQATEYLKLFMEYTTEARIQELEDDIKANHVATLRGIVSEIGAKVVDEVKPKSFYYGVLQSIVGAFCFALLMAALLFFLNLSKQTYTFTIGGSGNTEITQTSCITDSCNNTR